MDSTRHRWFAQARGPRLMRREWLFVALALGFAALAGLVVFLSRPTTLTIAVGPRDGPEAALVETYARELRRAREDVRLDVVATADVRESAGALRTGRADLAIVRPDVALPENGLTLAVLHDEALVIAAPAASDVDSVPDLARRRLGVVVRHEADLRFLGHLLDFYDFSIVEGPAAAPDRPLPASGVGLVPLKAAEVAAAIEERRVDAVAVIAAPTSKAAVSMVRAVAAAAPDKRVALVDVPDAKAIVQRYPELQPVTVPAGTFGGRPAQPEEDVETLGVAYRLMARGTASRVAVASVVQHLFEWRPRLAGAAPIANQIRAPDYDTTVTATSARLPNHPGAVDYFEREQQTFLERYEDWVYLLAFFGGTLGSGVAWLGQRLARKRRERVDVVLDRLLDILGEARAAETLDALRALSCEMDGLVADVVRQARERAIDIRLVSALMLAIDAAQVALDDARRRIAGTEPAAPGRPRAARLIAQGGGPAAG